MKKPSFRVRIALLSATITGASLIAFSFVFWWLIYNAYSGRLDAELKINYYKPTISKSNPH